MSHVAQDSRELWTPSSMRTRSGSRRAPRREARARERYAARCHVCLQSEGHQRAKSCEPLARSRIPGSRIPT